MESATSCSGFTNYAEINELPGSTVPAGRLVAVVTDRHRADFQFAPRKMQKVGKESLL